MIAAITRSDIANYVGWVFYVYILIIFLYIVLNWLFAAGVRPPYSRWSDATRDVPARHIRALPAHVPPTDPHGRDVRLQPDDRDHPPVLPAHDHRQRDQQLNVSGLVTIDAAVTAPKPRSTTYARAAALAAAIVGLDQLTKRTVAAGIAEGGHERLIPGVVKLVHVRNTGVAFGFFSGGGALVLVFTLVALTLLIGYFLTHPARRGLWLPTGLLVGGALGNLIDRLANGAVTDFIKLPHWPAFNVADMSITFGVLALVYVLESARARGA